MAEFSVNIVPIVAELTRRQQHPTTCCWDLLTSGSWTFDIPCRIELEKHFQYVEIAPQVKALHDKGASIESLAAKFRKLPAYIKGVLEYAETGVPPKWKWNLNAKRKVACSVPAPRTNKCKKYGAEIARLRDDDQLSFPAMCAKIEADHHEKISVYSARRAYRSDASREI